MDSLQWQQQHNIDFFVFVYELYCSKQGKCIEVLTIFIWKIFIFVQVTEKISWKLTFDTFLSCAYY